MTTWTRRGSRQSKKGQNCVNVVIECPPGWKVLLQFLPKSEGTIASPTPLLPTILPIDKENKNDLDSTEADPCQKEPETLVKEDSVIVTIHESTDEEIVAEKIVEIHVDKEETDELIENGDDADDLTKALL